MPEQNDLALDVGFGFGFGLSCHYPILYLSLWSSANYLADRSTDDGGCWWIIVALLFLPTAAHKLD